MSKKDLQDMIDLVPDYNVDKVRSFLIELFSECELKPEVQKMVMEELSDLKENGGTLHEDINWK